MKHEKLIGISMMVGLALIVLLGFQAASATAERNRLRDELVRTLERENACIIGHMDHMATP